ncbi:DUF302 domain-containing protein [Rhodocyclus tenuis]|uniref:Uncharacterized protein (DUF302 family) n=1 Tax=Rhodocyclus tenuis TaxID=1066 RepID=A0A840FUC7_RHOTE|nr:DUF302 domain-containing protein [Rhodocyclus tenuis]MBB4245677.1 uncharacterized protein (DUF302 family) [Rhodocyclus tenuis]
MPSDRGKRWRRRLLALACCLSGVAAAAEDVVAERLAGTDFRTVHELLVESIEAEGLRVREVIPFNAMLERTAPAFGRVGSPFAEAEIVQFCSSALAWQMLGEDPEQIALCPMSIAVFVPRGEAAVVTLVYRSPGQASAGRLAAGRLLRRLLDQVGEALRQRGGPPAQ